ncbi:370R [Invertebrate iridescent virus Kaz2018]|uniref:370R n=1 Tax=Invertebrate iridescent virus 6 TaxID=176652 RepID=Q91FF4_IIV6|nr:370R [Invertebrate iridescent virus 6]AAK82230.1 370R [Invertebrate iridescent virus 6]QMS79615.1 hypothetical protein IIV6-T1_363 [Invertebrate iridescent virus 6]QNH08780.1 370R [Invertebrate iridescent virus Kaz2018]
MSLSFEAIPCIIFFLYKYAQKASASIGACMKGVFIIFNKILSFS